MGAIAALVGLAGMPGVAAAAVGNGMIAYGGDDGFAVMSANGSGSVPLFSTGTYDRPAFSPDGNAVAVRSWPDGAPRPNIGVARFDTDDGVHVLVTDGGLPAWSPDSSRLAYARYAPDPADDTDIRVVNADGTGDALVIHEPRGYGCAYREFNEGLWWLPDGRLLYGCGPDVVTINPDGSGRTTHGSVPLGGTMYDADLSPDGTRFAGPIGEGDVGVWNWTTGATAKYTNDAGDPYFRTWFAWSPDGTKILYDGATTTRTIPAGGGGESTLAPFAGYQYAWQPCVSGVTVTCAPKTLDGTLTAAPGGGSPPPTGGGPAGGGTTGPAPTPPKPPRPVTAFDAKPVFPRRAAKQASAKTIAVKVGCDARSAEPCAVALAARTAQAVASRKKRKLTVAKARATVAPGATRKVTLRLSKKARKLLRRKRKLKLVITATSRRSDGATATARTRFTARRGR